MFYVEAKPRSKLSTGSRSSDRRNVLVFRRSDFSRDADDGSDDDVFDKELPISPAPQDHCSSEALEDLQVDAAASDDAVQYEKPDAAAAAVTMTTDNHNNMSSCVLSTCCNYSIHTEPGKFTDSQTKTSVMLNQKPTAECEASSHNSEGMEPRLKSLMKGEIPTFYSLNTSPPSAKRNATASRVTRDNHKNCTNAASKTKKSKAASRGKSTTSDKQNVAKLISDDRRLTFVVKDVRGVKECSTSGKMHNKSSVEVLEDCCNADVEDIMDQNEEILQDVSGSLELFASDDSNTLVPSLSNSSSVTLVPDGSCSSVPGTVSDVQHPAANPRASAEKVNTKPAATPTELQAGDTTSLIVTDMELTSVNTSRSPIVFGSVSDNATFEIASASTADSKPVDADRTVIYSVANKNNQKSVKDEDVGRSLSTCTRSKSRKTITISKQAKTSTSSGTHEENVNSQQQLDAQNQPLGNCDQESFGGRRKPSVRVHSKNRKMTTVKGPTELPVDSGGDEKMENSDGCKGTTNLKTSANSKHMSTGTVGAVADGHQRCENSQTLQLSTASKGSKDSSVEDVLPKKVAAYMTKPGKIVYSTAQRHSTSTEPSARKSQSKSRSVLPPQFKPRSKQLLATTSVPVDSPSSAFSFDGTPKEDMICRPAAMLAARKKFISMDDSMLVSEPSEKPPTMRQRSLSSDDVTSSPHGIMLVLHNGKRTKPRTARSKSVRYGTSETVCTPPPLVEHKKLDVPLTPYNRASEHPSSTSTDLANAAVGTVPESPVFLSTDSLQQKNTEDISQSAVTDANRHLGNEDQDMANMNKVLLFSYFAFTVL